MCKLKESGDSKLIPLPKEEEFKALCPVTFYPLQMEAVRWMYWIETSKRAHQVGGMNRLH
jgi:hypothetical protein